jgi:hypothetical protein
MVRERSQYSRGVFPICRRKRIESLRMAVNEALKLDAFGIPFLDLTVYGCGVWGVSEWGTVRRNVWREVADYAIGIQNS